jgi:hypothetical protein
MNIINNKDKIDYLKTGNHDAKGSVTALEIIALNG